MGVLISLGLRSFFRPNFWFPISHFVFVNSNNFCFNDAFSINSRSRSSAMTLIIVNSSSCVFFLPLLPAVLDAVLNRLILKNPKAYLSLSVDRDLVTSFFSGFLSFEGFVLLNCIISFWICMKFIDCFSNELTQGCSNNMLAVARLSGFFTKQHSSYGRVNRNEGQYYTKKWVSSFDISDGIGGCGSSTMENNACIEVNSK